MYQVVSALSTLFLDLIADDVVAVRGLGVVLGLAEEVRSGLGLGGPEGDGFRTGSGRVDVIDLIGHERDDEQEQSGDEVVHSVDEAIGFHGDI